MSHLKKIILLFILYHFFVQKNLSKAELINYETKSHISTGIGKNIQEAILDAEKNTINIVLEDFLQTQEEKENYKNLELNINRKEFVKFIKFISKKSIDSGREITAEFEVSYSKLKQYLISNKIILDINEINKNLSFPTVSVVYDELDLNLEEEYKKWVISRVNNFLLSKGFKTLDSISTSNLKSEDNTLSNINKEDNFRLNSDIYIKTKITLEEVDQSGDFRYFKSYSFVEVYEGLVEKPIISKTYRRISKNGEDEAFAISKSIDVTKKAVIEEAIAGVMPQLEKDLMLNWKNILKNGKSILVRLDTLSEIEKEKIKKLISSVSNEVYDNEKDFIVKYIGSSDDLADILEEKLISENIIVYIDNISLNRFTITNIKK